MKLAGVILVISALFLPFKFASASETDAKNVLTVATGSVPSKNDPRIATIDEQLKAITRSCSATSSGAGIHDKLVKSYSDANSKNPSLLIVLSDFVGLANIQCKKFSDTMLLALYALEREEGATHSATIAKLKRNPSPLIAKWSSRPVSK
jgi:hypothetical protein